MMSASDPLEDAVLQLTTYNRDDYSRKDDLKGSCPLFTTDVYQPTAEKEGPTSENPGKGRVLANQLAKHYNVVQHNFVINVLQKWAESITNTKHVEDNCSVWVSDHLHLDLNIPITRSPPNGFCLQAVFLGKHLPPFILTLYDKCKTANEEEFRDFTTECSQLLAASIINFGHTDFVLLPCVLARDPLNPTTLEEEVAEQVKFSRRYYRGPRQLSVAAYKDLKKAVTAVSAVSYVPFFLQERKTDRAVT
nr:hypothetical protein BaRGS_032926 [Batillaria attramentaria]